MNSNFDYSISNFRIVRKITLLLLDEFISGQDDRRYKGSNYKAQMQKTMSKLVRNTSQFAQEQTNSVRDVDYLRYKNFVEDRNGRKSDQNNGSFISPFGFIHAIEIDHHLMALNIIFYIFALHSMFRYQIQWYFKAVSSNAIDPGENNSRICTWTAILNNEIRVFGVQKFRWATWKAHKKIIIFANWNRSLTDMNGLLTAYLDVILICTSDSFILAFIMAIKERNIEIRQNKNLFLFISFFINNSSDAITKP